MYKVYVLMDEDKKLYKGMTGNLKQRLRDHNRGHTKTTSKLKNLKLVYTEEFPDRESARKREIYLKTAAGRRFLKDKLDLWSSSSAG